MGYCILATGPAAACPDIFLECRDSCEFLLTAYTVPMTMTFDIPADVHARVASIPDLGARIEMFLRHEAELEAIRREKFGTEARMIAARAVDNSRQIRAQEIDWDESFENLRRQHQTITNQL